MTICIALHTCGVLDEHLLTVDDEEEEDEDEDEDELMEFTEDGNQGFYDRKVCLSFRVVET